MKILSNKMKDLMDKVNPYVIDLNLETQLKDLGIKIKEELKANFNLIP